MVSLRARDLLPNLHSKGVTTVLPLDPILDLQILKLYLGYWNNSFRLHGYRYAITI